MSKLVAAVLSILMLASAHRAYAEVEQQETVEVLMDKDSTATLTIENGSSADFVIVRSGILFDHLEMDCGRQSTRRECNIYNIEPGAVIVIAVSRVEPDQKETIQLLVRRKIRGLRQPETFELAFSGAPEEKGIAVLSITFKAALK